MIKEVQYPVDQDMDYSLTKGRLLMATDKALQAAEKKIAEALRNQETELDLSYGYRDKDSEKFTELLESLGQLTQLQTLDLSGNQLTALPESLGQLTQLHNLYLNSNQLTDFSQFIRENKNLEDLRVSSNPLRAIPEWIGELHNIQILEIKDNLIKSLPKSIVELQSLHDIYLGNSNQVKHGKWQNDFTECPEPVRHLKGLKVLWLNCCSLRYLPDWIGNLNNLENLNVSDNDLADLPSAVNDLTRLEGVNLDNNPLNPELAAAYKEGLDAVKRYLRAKTEAQVVLNEAKLILIGEGEVGKSCLLGALRGDPWEEDKPSTHGIEIKPVKLTKSLHWQGDHAERLGFRWAAGLSTYAPIILHRPGGLSRCVEAARRPAAGSRKGVDQAGKAPRAGRQNPGRRHAWRPQGAPAGH